MNPEASVKFLGRVWRVAVDDPGEAIRQRRNLAVVTQEGEPPDGGLSFVPPAIQVSAGAMIFDRAGRLLILKPTYKSGWTIPGGVMEADGETPWQACRREVREECGLDVPGGRLACVDFRPSRPGKPGGIRFLFDCGVLDDDTLGAVVPQQEEISQYRIVPLPEALALLRRPIRRRVRATCKARAKARPKGRAKTAKARASTVIYLENGRPVPGVGP
jgi:8-oxo-dGTP diphosphatase